MKNKSEEIVLTEHLVNAAAVQQFLTNKIGEQFDAPSSTCISDLYSASLVVRHDIEKEICNNICIGAAGRNRAIKSESA